MIAAGINYPLFEDIDDKEILNSIASLPAENDLPYDDGVPMETSRHRDQMNLLIDSLKAYWKDSRKYYVGGNMFLHFDILNRRKFRGPDFFLVTDVDNRERKSWVVWQEEMRFPDLIIELLSDTTRKTDKGEKKELYGRIFRTPEYYIYDPFTQEFGGYRLSGNFYKDVLPDPKENRIYSPITGLYLVIKENWLRWMTNDGYILPSHEELFEQEKQRAEQEKHRADIAEKCLNETIRKMLAKGKLTVDDLLTVVDFYRQTLTEKFSLNVFYERR